MIVQLEKTNTRISIINNIPKKFFSRIEEATTFGDHLFPTWSNRVFRGTNLKNKFKAVYDRYKNYKTDSYRRKIRSAFKFSNQIEKLCSNEKGTEIITLSDLPKKIQDPISELFKYLYKTAINYSDFQDYVDETLSELIDRFLRNNQIEVCPFCGLEGYLNLEGQARLSLDHWLPKSEFPMAAVNLNNLIPIGNRCNQSPAKGEKNILLNENKDRIKAFYPLAEHSEVNVEFSFNKEPTIDGIKEEDWDLNKNPNDTSDEKVLASWASIMNIDKRYNDYLKKYVFTLWKDYYKHFIENTPGVSHANSIDELKDNFQRWKAWFPLKTKPGAILYRAFIDYLIEEASDKYLYSLYRNFNSQ